MENSKTVFTQKKLVCSVRLIEIQQLIDWECSFSSANLKHFPLLPIRVGLSIYAHVELFNVFLQLFVYTQYIEYTIKCLTYGAVSVCKVAYLEMLAS